MNASTIKIRKRRTSSGDTTAVHPYVVEEKARMVANNEIASWTTAKIVRTKGVTKIIREIEGKPTTIYV